eukprot:298095_1
MNPFELFPKRFGQYLKEVDEVFEKDWPSKFFLEENPQERLVLPIHRASPRYEVLDHPEKFEVRIDVPGYKPNEIRIDLKAGGRILSIRGGHDEEEKGRKVFSSRFQQNFSLDPSIMTNDLVANLEKDKITITAPRKIEHLPESRKIDLLVGGKASVHDSGPVIQESVSK